MRLLAFLAVILATVVRADIGKTTYFGTQPATFYNFMHKYFNVADNGATTAHMLPPPLDRVAPPASRSHCPMQRAPRNPSRAPFPPCPDHAHTSLNPQPIPLHHLLSRLRRCWMRRVSDVRLLG